MHIPVLVVGHITKDGKIAGPKILEHMVDVVLHFEGDRNYLYRILRTPKTLPPRQNWGFMKWNPKGYASLKIQVSSYLQAVVAI